MPVTRGFVRGPAPGAALSFVVLVAALSGCGGSRKPDRGSVPVSGTVTYQGKPLTDANIYFYSDKFSGYGKTDAAGKYRIAQGAMPGQNKVFVTKMAEGTEAIPSQIADDPGQVAAASAAAQAASPKKKVGELLPPELSDPERTKLTFTVPAEGTEAANFNF